MIRKIKAPITFVPAQHLHIAIRLDGGLMCTAIGDTFSIENDTKKQVIDKINETYHLSIDKLNQPVTIPIGSEVDIMSDNRPIFRNDKVIARKNIFAVKLCDIGIKDMSHMMNKHAHHKTRKVIVCIIMPSDMMPYDVTFNQSKNATYPRQLHVPIRFIPSKHLKTSFRFEKNIYTNNINNNTYIDKIINFMQKHYSMKINDFDAIVKLPNHSRVSVLKNDDTGTVLRLGNIGTYSGQTEEIVYKDRKIYIHIELSRSDMYELQNKL